MADLSKMNKRNMIIIILLMLVSGLLIYYLYLKPEAFGAGDPPEASTEDTSSTPPAEASTADTSSTPPQTTTPIGCATL